MRKRILPFVLASVLMPFCIPVFAQSEYVDLGLSVKWAACNVGADKPEGFGSLFAWGETEPRAESGSEKYKYSKGAESSYTKYCTDKQYGYKGFIDNKTSLDPDDDVAHILWGGDWRLPTADECQELLDKCTWTCDSINGVNGYRVTSNVDGFTDRSIFLPAAGGEGGYEVWGKGSSDTSNNHVKGGFFCGNYWSRSLDATNPKCAKSIAFISFGRKLPGVVSISVGNSSRSYLHSVRPVHP